MMSDVAILCGVLNKMEVGASDCLLLLAVLARGRMMSDMAILCRVLSKMEVGASDCLLRLAVLAQRPDDVGRGDPLPRTDQVGAVLARGRMMSDVAMRFRVPSKMEVGASDCLLLLAVLARGRMMSDVAILCRVLT